ncbi:MAG: ATP-binding protein [Euryarchaeota archaeon]|nr:ATP-binding protein [Euryarchaeota archaeon]
MAYIRREIEPAIEKWLDDREIMVIRGPRQSGKTTLLGKIEEMLQARGVGEEEIHTINFEDDLVRLRFEEDVKEFVAFYMTSGKKQYFLMDEVQYIKDVGKKLKLLFDTFDDTKFIVTGSSSFDLTNLGSYLVGRAIFFDLHPFSFSEFLRAKGEKYATLHEKIKIDFDRKEFNAGKTVFLDDLNRLLHEYLTFGSYPRVVLEKDPEKKKELIRNLFITYIEKDIVSLYGIKHREGVVRLLKAISVVSGNVVTYETLAEHTGLKYHEIRKVLPLLEDSFVVYIVRPFYKNLMNELRKSPKIYFVDYGIRNYLKGNFENIVFDTLYENFVHNELKRLYDVKYWRTTAKTEVDFVVEDGGETIPVEVKTTPKLTRAFRSFIRHYHPSRAIIANLNTVEKTEVDGCKVSTIPFVYL